MIILCLFFKNELIKRINSLLLLKLFDKYLEFKLKNYQKNIYGISIVNIIILIKLILER